jgi:hypothetical protein
MTRWADHGFVAGACGIRTSFGSTLPSSVFYDEFLHQIMASGPAAEEVEARISYAEDMQRRLCAIEETALERRLSRVGFGIAARTVAVVLIMIAIAVLIVTGHPGAGVALFIASFCLGAVMPKIAGTRDRALAEAAFSEPANVRTMPWLTSEAFRVPGHFALITSKD